MVTLRKKYLDCGFLKQGHPVPDENSCRATEQVIQMVSALGEEDVVLFLVSGGGSALFEKPLIPLAELENITNAAVVLRSGYHGDQYHPQTAFGSKGRQVWRTL